MSVLLIVAGLFVAQADNVSSGIRVFGWVLVLLGALGVVSAALLWRRRR
jgi:hypothetical protein